jgi:hypothetical protein
MQYINIKKQLLSGLGDTAQAYYTDDDLDVAIQRSVSAYSQYFPSLKALGTCVFTKPVATGSTTFEMIGGFPAAGVVYILGYGSPVNEQITVSSVAYTEWNTTIITTTTEVINAYYPGMLVSLVPSTTGTPVLGLQLEANQDTYQLPLDFLRVDAPSFSIAIGDRAYYKQSNAYYDESEAIFNRLNASGYGMSQGWAAGGSGGYPGAFPTSGGAIPNPFQTGVLGSGGATVYNFILGDFPFVQITPVPLGTNLLTFKYYGLQTLATLSNDLMEIVVLYAIYAAAQAKAQQFLERGDTKTEDYTETNSKIAATMQSLAESAHSKWMTLGPSRPYITSG